MSSLNTRAQVAAAAPTPEQGLSKLLSIEQLTELAVLISNIADLMRGQITASFDVSVDGDKPAGADKPPRTRLGKGDRNPNLDQHTLVAPTPTSTRSGFGETEANVSGRRLQARRERDLDKFKLQELRNDATEFFQSWRDGIVSKVVDAVNAKDVEENFSEEITIDEPDANPPPDYNTLGAHINTKHSDTALSQFYPPTITSLSSLPGKKRIELVSAMLLLILSKGHYAAHSRILLLYMVSSLHLPLHILQDLEIKFAQGLLESAKRMSAAEEAKKRSQENQTSRRWKVGLAGVAGAALIGVTGGLAAPLVAGAIGSVMGGIGLGATAAAGLLGTLSSSGIIVGSLFGAYGYGMTSKMMDQYAKEVEDFAFIPMRRSRRRGNDVSGIPADERRLRVTVGISGWLTEKRDVMKPWRKLGQQNEVFALCWELDALLDMGKSLDTMVSSAVWTVASREIISRTVLASLMFAMWPIALLKLSMVVDNPFNVAKTRADKAGLVLADAIINKAQGERPITLIGYSMGARLIYSCLMSLAERRAFGLVESAVFIGAPTPSDNSVWRAMRSVVAGRLVNVYSEKDYVLGFLYRTSSIQFGIAGLEEIQDVKGVENVDATNLVSGHLRYPHLVGTILEHIGWEDINMLEVEKEQRVVKMLDMEEEKKKAESVQISSKERTEQHQTRVRQGPDPIRSGREKERSGIPAAKKMTNFRKAEDNSGMEQSERNVIPIFHERPNIKHEEEALISFDEEPIKTRPEELKQPELFPKEHIADLPKTRAYTEHKSTEEDHAGTDLYDEEEFQGIVMCDNEEQGITMLDPVPVSDDEGTYLGPSKNHEVAKETADMRHDAEHVRMQQAWDRLDLGKRGH